MPNGIEFSQFSQDAKELGNESAVSLSKIQQNEHIKDLRKGFRSLKDRALQLHGQISSAKNFDAVRLLRDDLKQAIVDMKGFTDPEEILKYNDRLWSERRREVKALYGDSAGPVLAELDKFALLANDNAIRISEGKLKDRAEGNLFNVQGEMLSAIKTGDLDQAYDKYIEAEATVNRHIVDGLFDETESKALLQNTRRSAANGLMMSSLTENEYVSLNEGKKKARELLGSREKAYKGLMKYADDNVKSAWLKWKKNLADKPNLVQVQQEANAVTTNWLGGRISSRDAVKRIGSYKSALRKAIADESLSPTGIAKAKQELVESDVLSKIMNSAAGAGATLNNGELFDGDKHFMLDFSKSHAEVANRLGLSTTDSSFENLVQFRSRLASQLHVKGDIAATQENLYEFTTRANGTKQLYSRGEFANPVDQLESDLMYNQQVGGLFGNNTAISKRNVKVYEELINSRNPGIQSKVSQITANNPGLLTSLAKHRDQLENVAVSQSVLSILGQVRAVYWNECC